MIRHARLIPVLLITALVSPAVSAAPRHCPPGHAKQGRCNSGQALEQAYRQGYRDGVKRSYRKGDYLRERDYVRIGPDGITLPFPKPGQDYVRVGNDIFLIATATGLILDALSN